MALLYNYGDRIISENELTERTISGMVDVAVEEFFTERSGSVPRFTPVGIGKPLSIEIISIYSGDAPQKTLGGKKDLMVASAIKSNITYDAAPRMINQLISKVKDHKIYEPSAVDSGSPIVYYTPALDINTVTCTFELVAERFSRQVFDDISSLFKSASGLPIFAPASSFLMAGTRIVDIMGSIGRALSKSNPFLKENYNIRLDTPLFNTDHARQIVICNDEDVDNLTRKSKIVIDQNTGKPFLVNKQTQARYEGDAPYILISIDGRERHDLENFTPKLASSAMLDRFYGDKRGANSTEIIEKAMVLYNDYFYHEKAKKLKEKLAEQNGSVDSNDRGQKLLEAYSKNITHDVFKVDV